MSLFGRIGRARGSCEPNARAALTHEEKRKSIRSALVCGGSLACVRCDAPVALGAEPVLLSDQLTCPFCLRTGPARDFLSLASPTRPARVIVRAIIP